MEIIIGLLVLMVLGFWVVPSNKKETERRQRLEREDIAKQIARLQEEQCDTR